MNRFAKVALGCALLATPEVVMAAYCDDVGNQSHEVRVLFNGFFPNTLYACPGDTVNFVNASGRWARFKLKDEAVSSFSNYLYYSPWTAPNGSRTYTILSGVDGLDMGAISLSGASNPYQNTGSITFAAAPTSY